MISTKSNSYVKLLIALTALVSTTQAITCNSSSPQCCWVWRVRELMKLSLSGASTTIPTSCCQQSLGIACVGTSVVAFYISNQGLTGSIPAEIENLKDITDL